MSQTESFVLSIPSQFNEYQLAQLRAVMAEELAAVVPDAEPWRLLTGPEAAERLSIGETTLRELVADGELPYVLYQRAKRYRLDDLKALAARRLVYDGRDDAAVAS